MSQSLEETGACLLPQRCDFAIPHLCCKRLRCHQHRQQQWKQGFHADIHISEEAKRHNSCLVNYFSGSPIPNIIPSYSTYSYMYIHMHKHTDTYAYIERIHYSSFPDPLKVSGCKHVMTSLTRQVSWIKDNSMLKYTAIRLVMDSLENMVSVILTQHFEASKCAENTNKSHELNSLVALRDFQIDYEGRSAAIPSNWLQFFTEGKISMAGDQSWKLEVFRF